MAFVGAANLGNNGGSGNLSTSYTCGAGSNRLLVVAVKGDSSSDNVTGATYNGVAMTLAAKKTPVGGGNRWVYLFLLTGPATGSNALVVSGSGGYVIACAADYDAAAAPPDATATGQVSTGGSLTGTLTTVADNCWAVMAWGGYDSGGLPTAGSGATRRAYDAAFGTLGLFDSGGALTPAGSHSLAASYPGGGDGTGINLAVASFAPAGGGGGGAAEAGAVYHAMLSGGSAA